MCDSGRRSTSAAFLFSGWGLRAESVVGGLLEIRLAQGSPAADRANISELHDVLETVDNALTMRYSKERPWARPWKSPSMRSEPTLSYAPRLMRLRCCSARSVCKTRARGQDSRGMAKAEEDFAALSAMRARLKAEVNRSWLRSAG